MAQLVWNIYEKQGALDATYPAMNRPRRPLSSQHMGMVYEGVDKVQCPVSY